jgi:hypothetical protein
MSAMELKTQEAWTDKPERCKFIVIYDDIPCRDAAIGLCYNLAHKLEDKVDITIFWWNTKYLIDRELVRQASDAAAQADLIILSTKSDYEIAPEVKAWIDEWLPMRMSREGAITVLTRQSRYPELLTSPLGTHMNLIAQKAQLDFLTPQALLAEDACETLRMREQKVTPVLDEIMERHRQPVSHWGLNE